MAGVCGQAGAIAIIVVGPVGPASLHSLDLYLCAMQGLG